MRTLRIWFLSIWWGKSPLYVVDHICPKCGVVMGELSRISAMRGSGVFMSCRRCGYERFLRGMTAQELDDF